MKPHAHLGDDGKEHEMDRLVIVGGDCTEKFHRVRREPVAPLWDPVLIAARKTWQQVEADAA